MPKSYKKWQCTWIDKQINVMANEVHVGLKSENQGTFQITSKMINFKEIEKTSEKVRLKQHFIS